MWGAVGMLGGCCGRDDGGTDPRTDPDLCSPSDIPPGAEEREGGVGDMTGRGERMLHKPEAIQEQLPVAWKHLCDSGHWKRRCKKKIYIYMYVHYVSPEQPPKHHLILWFLFIDFS